MKQTAKFFVGLALVLGLGASQAQATSVVGLDAASLAQAIRLQAIPFGLNWKIGDTNSYSVDMGFLKGTMVMKVRSEVPEGFWLDQDIDLQIQKQKVEALVDKATGQIKKLLVNGQEQQVPANDMEVIEMKETEITVPAGSFKAIYVRVKNKADGKELEQWINPQTVPINGMLKSVSPSQFGNVTLLLESFAHGN